MLGYIRDNDCPLRLEPPAGAKIGRNATVKIQRNPPRHQTDQVRDVKYVTYNYFV